MTLDSLVRRAREKGASDVHLEAGLPVTVRVRGELSHFSESVGGDALSAWARELLGEEGWREFLGRGSADLSCVLGGTRVRVNVLRSARGVGFALRLLATSKVTLERLNLHPSLEKLIAPNHGLVLISGPTGSGKTSTLAALLQEVNLREAKHLITLESPIEYALTPRQSFIRQREVGRDTPSFEQGLLDALREDPDVLMVGEMREPEVMRLTLSAAETGHLVLATLHSGSISEALQRIVASFAPEQQGSVCAQLAESLVGVVAQRLVWHPSAQRPVPECEVLMASTPARALIRTGQFFKLGSVLETGLQDGSWTFARYREWLDKKRDWQDPGALDEPVAESKSPALPPSKRPAPAPAQPSKPAAQARLNKGGASADEPQVLSVEEAEDPQKVLEELEGRARG